MTSIRQRTLGLALLVFGISMLVIGCLSYRYAAHEIEALYDASLAQNARLLEGILQAPLPEEARSALLNSVEDALERAVQSDQRFAQHRDDSKLAFQLWQQDHLLLRSTNAPDAPMAGLPPALLVNILAGTNGVFTYSTSLNPANELSSASVKMCAATL